MKNTLSSLILAAALCLTSTAQAQLEFPSASPRAKLEQKVGLGTITIDYSRPSLKGRKMLGEQVPYEAMWRTGANAATKITFSEDVTIEGQKVAAGTYAVASIPGQSQWTVILSKDSNLNLAKYDQAQDAARFEVAPLKLATPVETLTFDVTDLRDDSARIVLSWADVAVPLEVKLDTTATVMSRIASEMPKSQDHSAGVYANAAGYYYMNGGDLAQALTWISKAVEMQPDAFYWLQRRAEILAKLGRKDEARAEADRALEMAKSNPAFREEYTVRHRQLIESL